MRNIHLIKKAQDGDAESFIELMDLHKEGMYKVARAYLDSDADIADAMQETILNCYEKLNTLEKPRFFKTWLIRILINNCNDILRQSKRVVLTDDYAQFEISSMETDPRLAEFHQIMELLDERYRAIFVLYYVEEFKIREIAKILDLNENTVSARLTRGRAFLKKSFLENEEKGVKIHEAKRKRTV